jgi:hypothetical protein
VAENWSEPLILGQTPRPEHVTAVDYLNENVPSDTQFYLIKLQAFRIGGSDPAPLFTIEAGPSEERTAAGETKKNLAEKDKQRYEFFSQLLECCREKTILFNNVSPVGYQNWVNAGVGKGGLSWSLVIKGRASRIELFLHGQNGEINEKRFTTLIAHKDEIEKAFGEHLVWDFKAGRKQHYIRSICPIGGLEDEDKWQEIQSDLVDRLIRMDAALKPWLKQLN